MEKKICIIGAGDFGRETLANIQDCYATTHYKIPEIVCFMDENKELSGKEIKNIPVISFDDFDKDKYKVVIAIGNSKSREDIVKKLPEDTEFTSVIHPTCVISEFVNIGVGAIVGPGVVITCDVNIGCHAHLNLKTTIGHDCKIGDFFTTAPASNISGECNIGDHVYFGTNSAIREGINISNEVTIGMGGVVVKDIQEKGVYVGNPVTKIKSS